MSDTGNQPFSAPLLHRLNLRTKFVLLVLAFVIPPVILGAFGLRSLSSINRAMVEISEVWMERVHQIDSLQTLLSDYRRQEASHVITDNEATLQQIGAVIATTAVNLDRGIENYRVLRQQVTAEADPLLNQFAQGWQSYQRVSARMIAESSADNAREATATYEGESRLRYQEIRGLLDEIVRRDRDEAEKSRRNAAQTYEEARTVYIAAAIGLLLLAIAAIGLMYADFSRPLLSLAGVMRRMAGNEPDLLIPHTQRHDEIGEMALALEVFRENTAALNLSLQRERELMDQQRNFITMASHEFRTPLTGIDGHARRLQRLGEKATAADIEERCGRIRAAVIRMIDLIDSVTRTAQWDEAAPLAHIREVDIEPILRDVVTRQRDQHPRRTVELILSPLPPVIEADPKLFEHAVSNLIGNGLKYSPIQEPVTVTAATAPDGDVLISVIDRGVGIPENERDRILGRFYRASNVAMTPGTGVGLYFVDQILKMHSGSLSVDSRVGEGSRFTIRLPARQPAPQT
jgi:signal transduction histidine kinase